MGLGDHCDFRALAVSGGFAVVVPPRAPYRSPNALGAVVNVAAQRLRLDARRRLTATTA